MTVRELITFLEKCSPDLKVGIKDVNYGTLFLEVDKEEISLSENYVLFPGTVQEYCD